MAESPESNTIIEPELSLTANGRVEIDTSVPFESVREAATRFGGFGFWKPSHFKIQEAFQVNVEEADIMEFKAQASELQNNLISKESETLEVLKELEATKATIKELSLKLQQRNEAYEEEIKPAGVVLKDLSQAKMNLCKTTVDLAGIRASVEMLNKKLQEEKASLEKTRERLMQKALTICCEASEKDLENEVLQRSSREAQEVEQTRDKIKTVKIRLEAARKMKEAARAAEAVAIAEIKAVTASQNSEEAVTVSVTLSSEEYSTLSRKAMEAEEEAKKRVEDAMSRVQEANVSKTNVLKKVNEAVQEIETSKKALEKAVERVDDANAAKLEAEEALRNSRLENVQRRRSSSVNNTSKFKNKRETTTTTTRLMDVNGLNLTYDVVGSSSSSSSSVPVLKPTMSIGQILSKKLLLAEDSNMNVANDRRKMSLGQMLAKNSEDDRVVSKKSEGKENVKKLGTRKRKSFGFAKISVLLNKNKKKKKKIALKLR